MKRFSIEYFVDEDGVLWTIIKYGDDIISKCKVENPLEVENG